MCCLPDQSISGERGYEQAIDRRPARAGQGSCPVRGRRRLRPGTRRIRDNYRGHYDTLAEIKRSYDPGHLFRLNQNIQPAA